jgi:hypothetical protein
MSITRARAERALNKAKELEKGKTSICEAIGLIRSRLLFLESDETFERPGNPAPGTEELHLKQVAGMRKAKEEALKGMTPRERAVFFFGETYSGERFPVEEENLGGYNPEVAF